jgi:hypothetical protein
VPEELLRQLTRSTGYQLLEKAPSAWLWKGFPVKQQAREKLRKGTKRVGKMR